MEISLKEIRAWIYAKICSLCFWWGNRFTIYLLMLKTKERSMAKSPLFFRIVQKAYGLQRAKDAGIETAVVKKDWALIVKMLKERNIDFIVLAGYLAILTDELIDHIQIKLWHSSFSYSFFLWTRNVWNACSWSCITTWCKGFRGQPCTLFQILSMGDRLLNKLLVIYRI